MDYCETNSVYLTNLRMSVGGAVFTCAPNACGYWQAQAQNVKQGAVQLDPELATMHGIGCVDSENVLHTIWAVRDSLRHDQVLAWRETRRPETQRQIIWARAS
jgi:hypothetical protein